MSREKQIEDMARIICGNNRDCRDCGHNSAVRECGCLFYAKRIYEQSYRKQSEGEWVYHEYVSSYDGAKSGYSCSRCDAFVDENVFETDEFHKGFCGNCGTKMKGVWYEQRKEN